MALRNGPGRSPSPMGFGHWLGLLAVACAGLVLWQLRDSLVLLFAALVLAQALCTLVGLVRRRLGCSRAPAVVLSLLLLAVVLLLIATVVIPPFVDQFSQLLLKLPAAALSLVRLLRQGLASASQVLYGSADPSLTWLRDGLLPDGSLPVPTAPPDLGGGLLKLLGLAGDLGTALLQLIFVLAVALMVALQPTAYREVAVLLVPSFYRRRFREVLRLCGDALSAWMVGVVISSLCVGSLAALGLWLLGVKLVAANAVLAGLLNVIPNIGPTLSTVFPMAVALLDAPWKALAVLLLYIGVQNLESYLITPSVMHHQLRLLPGLTLAAQLLFTVLFGPLGLLLALPLAVCVQVLVREVVIADLLDPWRRQRQETG